MPSREFTLYNPSDITRAANSDGTVAVTIAQNAISTVVHINGAVADTGLIPADAGLAPQPVQLNNRLPFLGISGEMFEVCFDSTGETAGYGFSFIPTPGVTYYSAAIKSVTALGAATPDLFISFTKGTMIDTEAGQKRVEELQVGDLVWTEANGFQPLRWTVSCNVSTTGDNLPVLFKAGAFGATADLTVAPSHRILLDGPEIELLFGIEKALVAASDLLNDETVISDRRQSNVDYLQIMFDTHQIVRANGLLCESFFPSPQAIASIQLAQRNELKAIFPHLEYMGDSGNAAYTSLVSYEVSLLSI